MEPEKWGPSFWKTFHIIASEYPNQPLDVHKQAVRQLIINIPIYLPCETCKKEAFNYIKIAKSNDYNLNQAVSNKYFLQKFFYDFHNTVNKRLKKPIHPIWDFNKPYLGFK